ncbi:LLM class flavin-dependent oxidoreductase [Micromonospora sp. NPDC049559]|uniref:LLM class flavin-dependent oxidoreductase n=1 Tax=Micromonospora sp. NPDC049559 TaxID=3155923 RepID=UPI003449EBBD
MPDYGHDLLFGLVLTPLAGRAREVVALARIADQSGLDLVSVADHSYQPAFLDAWTLLSVIAARTTRVRVFPNVATLPLRPPAALARAAASLDILSGGRAELGLGAGAYWDAIAAEGGPRRTPGHALEALREAVAVIRALWETGGEGAWVHGEHYRLDGASPGPAPEHHIAIWVGALKPRILRLVGQVADGWLPSWPRIPPHQLASGQRIVDDAAVAAGRSPGSIRRLYNIAPAGPPTAWAPQLAELTLEHGVSGFLLPTDSPEVVRLYAAEVVPAVRELVNAARNTTAPAR